MTSIALFTRDLRVDDNPMLHAAAARGDVIPLFVLDEAILGGAFNRPNRAGFLADSLADLDRSLRRLGGHLVVRRGDLVREVARLVAEHGVGRLHVMRDVSRYAQQRGRRLTEVVEVCEHDGVTIVRRVL